MKIASLWMVSGVVIFFSCNNPSTVSENKKADSVSVTEKVWTQELHDTTYQDVHPLSAEFIQVNYPQDVNDENWEVSEFLKIDSLKKANQYSNYLDKLDIGQMKDANAWVYDTLEFKNMKTIVWGITYSSFDACPYYSGKTIYLTNFSNEGKAVSTLKVLKNSNSADAPVYFSLTSFCKLESTGLISCMDSIVNGDQAVDEASGREYEDITKEVEIRKYQLSGDGLFKEIERKKTEAVSEKKFLEMEN